ncbi:type III-B CRISPR module-associated protein Cmr5 [bacterium]|nr:type III-B CRISPR module-associated protein Cmr5 [bacterium]
MKTISQGYAEKAWSLVGKDIHDPDAGGNASNMAQSYRSRATSLPAMVLQCGLAQTLAFVQAKSKGWKENDAAAITKAYGHWLHHLCQLISVSDDREDSFTEEVRSMDIRKYMVATEQALTAAAWLKRYAEAIIPAPDKDGDAAAVKESAAMAPLGQSGAMA